MIESILIISYSPSLSSKKSYKDSIENRSVFKNSDTIKPIYGTGMTKKDLKNHTLIGSNNSE